MVFALATVALTPSAASYHEPGCTDVCYCPAYDVTVGAAGQGVDATTGGPVPGSLVITTTVGDTTAYSVEDYFYVNALFAPGLFSLWWYEETNGVPGLQRWDEGCQTCFVEGCADTILNS